MDFIQQLKAFDEISAGNLTPNAIAIYYHLFHVNNRTGWKEWFMQSDYWIGQAVGIKRRETILAALNLLKQKGCIDFERGAKRNTPTKYRIIPLFNSAKHSAKDSAEHSTKDSPKHSAKDSAKTSDNPKQETTNEKPKQVNTKGARAKFIPPTLEEVEEYVRQNNLHVAAKDFIDFFTAGNWIDSKGNPVRNWKQKLLTWNKYYEKEVQRGSGTSGNRRTYKSPEEELRKWDNEPNGWRTDLPI